MILCRAHFEITEAPNIGVRGLAEAAERVLREMNPGEQPKGTVSDYPNERTIRFYLSEGLLPTPTEKRGPASLFNYRHLITLLVIKKLQSEGLPISVIKSLLAGREIDDLEKLLRERVKVFTDRTELETFIESSGKGEGEEVMVMSDPKLREDYLAGQAPEMSEENDASAYLSRLLMRRPDAEARPKVSGTPDSSREVAKPGGPEAWTRSLIRPGIELHLSDACELPGTERN
ncbi:MAG: MerR family transcriptional regulator [Chloracidobacterium sp.]|nr:MerR family transcriptional regulator [Chloracidobacterium sp.]